MTDWQINLQEDRNNKTILNYVQDEDFFFGCSIILTNLIGSVHSF